MHRVAARPLTSPPAVGLWALWVAALLAVITVAASTGGSSDPVAGLAVVLDAVIRAGWPAAAFLAASLGFGVVIVRWTGIGPFAVSFPAGVAAFLLVLHVLGTLGMVGTGIAVGITALGVAALTLACATRRRRWRAPPGWAWLGLPGLGVMLTAAASPPGVLWASEFGGYDVLSYHLQLPREWLAAGHTRPLEHNVYSYLPGALEVAYAHLGWLTAAPTRPGPGGGPGLDLLAGDGWRLISAQMLHAGLAVVAAMVLARFARAAALAAGARRLAARSASTITGAIVLTTPWTIVVGSMAYNEMGVVALTGGAMLAALASRRRGVARGVPAAALTGVACLVKPTAMVLAAPAVAAVLLASVPRRRLWPVVAGGLVAGSFAVSPWLVRNAVLTGNPVFPLASAVLGTGHWTPEQAGRFAEAHEAEGTLGERLERLVWRDPEAAANAPEVAASRGAANPQWGIAFPAGVLGLAVLVARRRARAVGLVLAAGLAITLVGWLTLTHMQSRFLIPCLVTIAPAVGAGCAVLSRRRAVGLGVGVLLAVAQAGASWLVYRAQLGGAPASMILPGPGAMGGSPYDAGVGAVSPTAFINHETPAAAVVHLVGDATPLYLQRRVVYATVWDDPPFLSLLDGGAKPGDFVLVNASELARLRGSGYPDPRITPEAIGAFTSRLTPVRSWPDLGVGLFRVPPGAGGEP